MRSLVLGGALLGGALLLACGGDNDAQRRATTTPGPAEETPTAVADYELHEWGLLSRTPRGIELAAGPGRRPQVLTIDKPVVYLHTNRAFDLSLTVELGEGWEVAERWPGSGPLTWHARVTPGACAAPVTFPSSCTSVDGYCETLELPAYVASDADCLEVAGAPAPLLFYRLRAPRPAAMDALFPVVVEDGTIRARAGQVRVWRVRYEGGAVQVARVEVGTAAVPLPEPDRPVREARDALHADLARLGMSEGERGAFERAWWEALFGAPPTEATDSEDEDGDAPVRDRRSIDSLSDGLVTDESTILDLPGAPRVQDAILYWLEDAAIDRMARLEATPAPTRVRRAFLVRQELP